MARPESKRRRIERSPSREVSPSPSYDDVMRRDFYERSSSREVSPPPPYDDVMRQDSLERSPLREVSPSPPAFDATHALFDERRQLQAMRANLDDADRHQTYPERGENAFEAPSGQLLTVDELFPVLEKYGHSGLPLNDDWALPEVVHSEGGEVSADMSYGQQQAMDELFPESGKYRHSSVLLNDDGGLPESNPLRRGRASASDQRPQDPGSDRDSFSEYEASPVPAEPKRGRSKSGREAARVRLRSVKGRGVYNQSLGEKDRDFADRVNGEREEKYKARGGIEAEEELTKKKVENVRNRKNNTKGFENIADGAKVSRRAKKEIAELMSDEGETEYRQMPLQSDKDFANEVNKRRRKEKKGKIKKEEELTIKKVIKAREKGHHPKGFTNIGKNATKKLNRRKI